MKKTLLFIKGSINRGLLMTVFLVAVTGMQIMAQSGPVTGKITSSDDGTAVGGVSVVVKGSSKGTISLEDGTFSINADKNATLVFSKIGLGTITMPVAGRSSFDLTMKIDNQALQQVVVVGYGTVKRKDLTGSVASISAETIAKLPVTSVEQSLQGRAAGVQVTSNDGAPGGNVNVLIRGTGSLASGANAPLYIVDGYPIGGGVNNISPDDIASIDVLKDASATAIYGIRAANGVVIITTKRGKKQGLEVSLNSYLSVQTKPKKYDLLNAHDWATLANQVADADAGHNFIEMPLWRTPDSLHNVDWQDALYRTGLTQNYNIGIRGGNDKIQSSMSVGFYNQKGIVLGSYFKRLSLGLNLDYTPTKWLKSSTSLKYSYQDAVTPLGTGQLVALEKNPPTLDNGNKLTYQIKDGNGNYGFYNPNVTFVAKYGNPVFDIENNQNVGKTNYVLGSSSLEITLLDGLKVKTNAGVNISDFYGTYYRPEDNRLNAQYSLGGPTQNAVFSRHLNNTFEWLWENTLSYDKTFGQHAINFVAGVSAQKNTNTLEGLTGVPPNSQVRDIAQLTSTKFDVAGNGQKIYTLESQFARLTYKFADKYLITGTIRRDGSSKFDVGHQWGVFPSGAVAWKMKEESFLKNVDWLSDLKLRGSYGALGNQGSIPLYQYQALYSTGYAASFSDGLNSNLGYPFNKVYQTGYGQIQPANPNLKWETDYITDFGLDAAFLNNALTITADWYKRRSKDFLLQLASPSQTGYNLITQNLGSMENTGVEFAVNYTNHKGRDFQYGIGLTLSSNRNRLTSIRSGTTFVTNFGGLTNLGNNPLDGQGWGTFSETNIGQAVGEFYGYKTLGIFQSQAQINDLNAKAQASAKPSPYYQKAQNAPGDRYFADVNGDGHVDASDRISLGSPQPKFFGGLNFDGSYKNFDFNLYFYGVYGNKILNYVESGLESFQNRGFTGVQNVSKEYYLHHWTPTNPSNRYAKATYNDDAIGDDVPSSTWVENGSFTKLKNITIGYTLPAALSSKISLTKVRIYVSSQNLFTITKYSGLDPEIGLQNGTTPNGTATNATQSGVDTGTYPSSRFFTVGLNVTF